ncbi:hypothetical protein FIBSPDRAFT_848302 [Athelia psychrophila]|uniref:Uncharacterized protein n=1 Tax=Athelia psychrophila TaxID=1759441 RepID=A0A166V8J1_9AGAM|nr:hypothetical protein FIBSPDRAFT_848302 [Fibularhizoctonia sp. CBS 109695]
MSLDQTYTRRSCAGVHPTSPTSKRSRTSQYPSPSSRSHAHPPTPAPVSASSLSQYHANIDASHPLLPPVHRLLDSLANPKDITELKVTEFYRKSPEISGKKRPKWHPIQISQTKSEQARTMEQGRERVPSWLLGPCRSCRG